MTQTRCRTCNHPERGQIDAEIRAGSSTRSISAMYGIPESTIREHKNRHIANSQQVAPRTSLERQRWLCRLLEAQISQQMRPGERAVVSREYRAAILALQRAEAEADALAAEASRPKRPLDLPGVPELLDRLLSSLSESARDEVVNWIQHERSATDLD